MSICYPYCDMTIIKKIAIDTLSLRVFFGKLPINKIFLALIRRKGYFKRHKILMNNNF